jgi:hypothetical protein
MIATVDNPSNAVEWALAEMVNRLVSLLSVLPQLKFWASYATGHIAPLLSELVSRRMHEVLCSFQSKQNPLKLTITRQWQMSAFRGTFIGQHKYGI